MILYYSAKIVEKFGEDSLDIIQNYPEELATIRGISVEKAIKISKEYEKQYGARDIMLLLGKYCSKLYDKEQINLEILNEKLYERLLILLFGGKACCHLEDEVKWQWVYKYYEETI